MTTRAQAEPTVQYEDDVVRVTRWDFPPHGETGHHHHDFDYVVVPVTTGQLLLETRSAAGASPEVTTAELIIGQSYARRRGVEHNVVNNNDFPLSFVEIEQL